MNNVYDGYSQCQICKQNTFDWDFRVCDNCQAYECNACSKHVAEDSQCNCYEEKQDRLSTNRNK